MLYCIIYSHIIFHITHEGIQTKIDWPGHSLQRSSPRYASLDAMP